MTAVAALESKLTPSAVPLVSTADVKVAAERAQIDSAAAGPVLIFFTTSIAWLLVSSLLGFITSMKLHIPNFLADFSWLTYGRVAPAYNLALTYGWASLVGMGVSIWLMSRLCRVPLRYPGVLVLGAVFWNLGLVMGIGSVLAGKNTGIPGLEIPFGAAVLMFIGYLLIGLWGAILYKFRRNAPVYISVWYLLGAFFWFPWFFGVAHLAVTMPQVQGVIQSVIAAWFSQNLVLLWFTPIGLAAAYYLIPKVVNRPIYSYNLASIGFWTFALFGGLTGMVRLSGGPIPAWFVTIGIAANIMMIVPIVTVLANFIFTMRGQTHKIYYSPTIRFTFFGVIAFAFSCLLGILTSLRSFDSIVHFTQFQAAQQHLVIYAFFSMVMFGAIYYITPRLVGCEWLSSSLIKIHFLGAAYGGATIIAMLAFSGLSAGLTLIDPEATFSEVIQIGQVYIAGTSLAFVFVTLAHLFFGIHFLLMLLRIGQPGGEPTLFANPAKGDTLMSRSSYLFAGIFGSFALSCLALVVVPQVQLGNLQPQVDLESGDSYPIANPRRGSQVYASEGCFYCHSQQIRDEQNGLDIERGWGLRRTVARDYIFTQPPFLGTMRLGPDLANIGSAEWRNEAKEDPRKPLRRNAAWHYLHLYQPSSIVTESNMPPYRYLFEKRKIGGQRSADALNVPTQPGYEVVPKDAAKELVSYLLSLDRTHPLNEVKAPAAAMVSAK